MFEIHGNGEGSRERQGLGGEKGGKDAIRM
jgi:hypothetical protein